MKGQALAIALVVAAGVAMFVMYLSTFDSLRARARLLRALALRRRVRLAQARAAALAAEIAAIPASPRRNARRRRRHARRAGAGRAGQRPADLGSGRIGPAGQRPVPASRPLDRAGAARRGARQRGVRDRQQARARRPRRRGHQRPPAPADHRRRRAVARVHLQHPARRDWCPTTSASASSGWTSRRWPPRSTWRAASTTSSLTLAPGASSDEVIARVDRLLEPYGGLGAIRARCRSRTGRSRTSWPSCRRSACMLPLIFLLGRGLHPQRRADARAGAAAAADRRAQGARLRQPRARLALPQVGARHRPGGRGDRRRRRGDGWATRSSASTTVLPLSRCCSSACRRRRHRCRS